MPECGDLSRTTHDPFGNEVELREEAWYHIVMERGRRSLTADAVLTVVRQPLVITQDKQHPARLCFYQVTTVLSFRTAAYLKVVVDYSRNPAVIVTAYPTDRIHPKETALWP
jgi:hypothetical protein